MKDNETESAPLRAYVFLLAREVPDVIGQGMSLSSIMLGGEWVNGRYNLYPAFATDLDARLFREVVPGANAYGIVQLEVAIDVEEPHGEN